MITNNLVIYFAYWPYNLDARAVYLYKSTLNYKVNINKLHFKADTIYPFIKTKFR